MTNVKTCSDCNGEGVIEKGTDDEQQCPTCGGSGFVPDNDDDEEVIRTASGDPIRRNGGPMSALGQKQTSRPEVSMSALPPKADIAKRD